MSVYRVIVSFNAYRAGDVVGDAELWDADKHVRSGYLKPIEEVRDVDGTGNEPAGLGSGDVDPGPSPLDVPRKRRKTVTPEVTDEPDRAVSDTGPIDGEEQGARGL